MKEELTDLKHTQSEISALCIANLSKNVAQSGFDSRSLDQTPLSFPVAEHLSYLQLMRNRTVSGAKRLSNKEWHKLLALQALSYVYTFWWIFCGRGSLMSKLICTIFFIGLIVVLHYCRAKPQLTLTDSGFQKRYYQRNIFDRLLRSIHKIPDSRPWSDITSVRFVKAENVPPLGSGVLLNRADAVVIDWNYKGRWDPTNILNTDYIDTSAFTPQQREKFFRLLSKNVPQEILSPEVLFLQLQNLSGRDDATTGEYTKIWLDEYSRRFEISNYVALSPGTKCGNGRYTITMLIRTKINASTYLAVGVKNNKVAIKELVAPVDCTDAVQTKILEQFNREASILSRLNHKSIVDIQDHFIENGRTYIVMDCVTGKNLREHIASRGCFPPAEVIHIGKQLASVLHYLHTQDPPILHRDLTPDNIVYSKDKSVVVLDFGAANVFTVGKTATLVGKQFYMPPEQFRGKSEPASDVYAFGATLSYLLSGRDLPSMGKLPEFDEPNISQGLIELLKDCTRFDANARPTADGITERLTLISESNVDQAKVN